MPAASKRGFMERWDPSQLTEDLFNLKHPLLPSQWKPRAGLAGCNHLQDVLIGASPEEGGPLMRKAFPFSSQTDIYLTAALHMRPPTCSKYSTCEVGPTLSLTSLQVRFFFPLM